MSYKEMLVLKRIMMEGINSLMNNELVGEWEFDEYLDVWTKADAMLVNKMLGEDDSEEE